MPRKAFLSLEELEKIQMEFADVVKLYRENTSPEDHLELLLRVQNLMFALKEFDIASSEAPQSI